MDTICWMDVRYNFPTAFSVTCKLPYATLSHTWWPIVFGQPCMNWVCYYDNDNDYDNILFDHNIQIEIIMYNSLENQIIDWSGDYY